jgi:hypothetical protein
MLTRQVRPLSDCHLAFGYEPKAPLLSPISLGHKSQLVRPITTTVGPRVRRDYYVFMTALVEIGWTAEKSTVFNNKRNFRFHLECPRIRSRAECFTQTL